MTALQEVLSLIPVGRKTELNSNSLGSARLIKNLILSEGQRTVYSFNNEGYWKTKTDKILEGLYAQGAVLSYQEYRHPSTSFLFSWKDRENSYLDLYINESPDSDDLYVHANLLCDNEDLFKFIKEYFSKLEPVQEDNTGYVFSIIRNVEGHLQLARLGIAGVALQRENYSKQVLADYDYVINDLKSATPSGRIAILEGAPGCGKTYLTRGMLMDVSNALFLIVPPAMVSSLGGAELLPLLLKQKESCGSNGPIVLILEDADQCLVPRGTDNISSISSLLNLTDGILGSLLDIRVIATTNAKKMEMDPAMLRDCRLSKRLEVQPLPYDQADSIFRRLINNETSLPPKQGRGDMYPKDKMHYSLAEIYSLARKHGWKPSVIKQHAKHDEVDRFFR